MSREHILSEIKRTAIENNGKPLGIDRFREATGIRKEDWYGIFWTKWSDAQVEAGLQPNRFGEEAIDETLMVKRIASLARSLGHVPTKAECKMHKRSDPEFPNNATIRRRLGEKAEQISKVKNFCKKHEGWED